MLLTALRGNRVIFQLLVTKDLRSVVSLTPLSRLRFGSHCSVPRSWMSTSSSSEIPFQPPKPPESFAKAYFRKPLYWDVRGTDLFKELQNIIGWIVIINILLCGAFIVRMNLKVSKKRTELGLGQEQEEGEEDLARRKRFFDSSKMFGVLHEENDKINSLKFELQSLDLLSHFKRFSYNDRHEMKLREKPETDGNLYFFDEYNRREDTGRDLTKLSMKELDALMRNDKPAPMPIPELQKNATDSSASNSKMTKSQDNDAKVTGA